MSKILSLMAGASLLALSGVATAEEPVVLGESALDSVTAAGTVNFNTNIVKTVDIFKTVFLDVDKDVDAQVFIDGRLATAEASADALGFDALAETDTFAQVDETGAFAFSESLAAVDNNGGTGE
ncbi:hypothetical protein HBA54_27595 [Pelagibius litoralis]|uniref:Uncharacterized protein n=1 Tax=Pelagibius litoralis TaxID=374515 RepID=A0A967KBU8_9PROT|nr:hypothetical protein [Pelagibius litoralis]NIA72358.1 hypothetical protein [Pelagibius litoralis]